MNSQEFCEYQKKHKLCKKKCDKTRQEQTEKSICNRTDEISFHRFYQQYIKEFQQQLYGVVDDEEILVKLSKE